MSLLKVTSFSVEAMIREEALRCAPPPVPEQYEFNFKNCPMARVVRMFLVGCGWQDLFCSRLSIHSSLRILNGYQAALASV
jgi:hypothetical protein